MGHRSMPPGRSNGLPRAPLRSSVRRPEDQHDAEDEEGKQGEEGNSGQSGQIVADEVPGGPEAGNEQRGGSSCLPEDRWIGGGVVNEERRRSKANENAESREKNR